MSAMLLLFLSFLLGAFVLVVGVGVLFYYMGLLKRYGLDPKASGRKPHEEST